MKRAGFFGRLAIGLALILGMGVATLAEAEAAANTAKITFHVSEAPDNASDLFGKYHDNRVGGIAFRVAGVWRTTNANGLVSWGPGAGYKALRIDATDFAGYEGAYVYCSNQVTKKVLYDGLIPSSGVITIKTTAGQPVICDWYLLT